MWVEGIGALMPLKRFPEVSQDGFLPRRILRMGYLGSIPISLRHMERPEEGSVVDLVREPRRITVLEYGSDPKAPAIEVEIILTR